MAALLVRDVETKTVGSWRDYYQPPIQIDGKPTKLKARKLGMQKQDAWFSTKNNFKYMQYE